MDLWELGLGSVHVSGRAREDLERLEPRESDMILELDSQLWGGELPVDVDALRRPDAALLEDYSELYKEKR